MNSTVVKVLIGLGVTALGIFAIKEITKKSYVTVTTEEDGKKEIEIDFKTRIKAAAIDKVNKILGFIVEHQEQIEAIATVLGVVTAVAEIAFYLKSNNDLKYIKNKMNNIVQDSVALGWNYSTLDVMDGLKESIAQNKPYRFVDPNGEPKLIIKVKDITKEFVEA